MTTINQQEAGAFYTYCAMRGLTTAEALDILAHTSWQDIPEDVAFGRRRHAATIRRLAKPLLARLDADIARAAAYRAKVAARCATYASLSAPAQAEIQTAFFAAVMDGKNKRARDIAAAHGVSSDDISDIARIITGRDITSLRYAARAA